jgi:PIN domain nuclease of toxin-antitoxin system
MIVAVADTHALVWALFGDSRLSKAAREALSVRDGAQIGVSAISFAEIVYLEEKNRIPAGTFDRLQAALVTPAGPLTEVPIDTASITAMRHVSRASVPDLPDRLIAASARLLGVPLVTREGKIRASGLATIW